MHLDLLNETLNARYFRGKDFLIKNLDRRLCLRGLIYCIKYFAIGAFTQYPLKLIGLPDARLYHIWSEGVSPALHGLHQRRREPVPNFVSRDLKIVEAIFLSIWFVNSYDLLKVVLVAQTSKACFQDQVRVVMLAEVLIRDVVLFCFKM